MMHSLGVFHEHTRPDQLQYITVNYDNIAVSNQNNFSPREASTVDLMGTEYSYVSIMHYGSKVRVVTVYRGNNSL